MDARDQERAFVAKMKASSEFASWVLSQTRFKGVDATIKMIRCDNPWYQSPKTGRQSETDIFVVFERHDRSERFALHIENKRLHDTFRPEQPELYHERAKDWLNVEKWGNYQDFEVLLIAPRHFYERYREQCEVFHRYIAHEQIAVFIPEFSIS